MSVANRKPVSGKHLFSYLSRVRRARLANLEKLT